MVKEVGRLVEHGDGLEYDPRLIQRNLGNIKEYLDSKKAPNEMDEALEKQKAEYKDALANYIAFNRKVAPEINLERGAEEREGAAGKEGEHEK